MLGDVGKIVGRYLQVIAVLSVLGLLYEFMLRGRVNVGPGFIVLFCAGRRLVRHSQLARYSVLTGAVLAVIVSLLVAVGVVPRNMIRVSFLGEGASDPSPGLVLGVTVLFMLMASVPLVLFLTPEARREFRDASLDA